MEKRVISTEVLTEERSVESSLRPVKLAEYVGQDRIKDNLKVYIEAAKNRGEALDHVLFYGPPGLGKTTLACIIASEMGSNIKITSGPAIAKTGDMASILSNLREGDVLFIDEIHRLNKQVEEFLYTAMEDYAMDVLIGKENSAKSVRIELPRWWERRQEQDFCRHRCVTVLAWYIIWNTTTQRSCRPLSYSRREN